VDSPVPVLVDTFSSGVASISAGGLHTCAVTTAGAAFCWGWAAYGQVGAGFFGSMDASSLPVSPYPVQGLSSGVASISAGARHTCAVTTSGGALCWGANEAGQLGDGTTTDRPGPVQVTGLSSGVRAIASGNSHTCAILDSGGVKCWGGNRQGDLGLGVASIDTLPYSAVPMSVIGLPAPVTAIAAAIGQTPSGDHTCVITVNGAVLCWGGNFYGELGDGEIGLFEYRASPTPVIGLSSGIVAVTGGANDSCALTSAGVVLCWGWNDYGELGDGTFLRRTRPVPVLRELAAGSLAGNDWFLNLGSGTASVPADRVPPFLVVTANAPGLKSEAPLSILADAQFRASDVGRPIYVFAYAPSSRTVAKDGPESCVLAQLNPANNLQQASASGLQAYVSNVTGAAHQAVTILNGVLGSQVAGAIFCLGTGPTAAQAVTPANSRCVATIPSTGLVCTPPEEAATAVSYEALWLKGDESGWGVNITHQGTTLFATWFTYDTDGSGMWLVASSVAQTSGGSYSGTLYRTVGPAFSANPFNSIAFPANYTTVGTLSFSFTDANTGTMSYTVNGVTQSKAITRYIYASGGTNCTLAGAQGASPNYQDLWLRSSSGATEAGWGINITHQGDILFATWFTYLPGSGSTNKGMWLVMSNGNKTAPGVYTGALQTTTGPAFSAVPFNPNSVVRTTVGTGTFTFTDASNGTFNYTVNGVTQSKPIARYVYASPATVCQ
jgi:hypothetical protein